MNKNKSSYPEDIYIDQKLLESLYCQNQISQETFDYCMKTYFPKNDWGFWISRLFFFLGISLFLAGIFFFFAYNWNSMSSFLKFLTIEVLLAACLLGAAFTGLNNIMGKTLLLSGSVLLGVFMAVFGQVYQTGSESYQLFINWSLMIFGWTLISNFAFQWFFWILLTNLSLQLWWIHAALPSKEMEFMIFVYMTLYNMSFLALREFFTLNKKFSWLQASWTRQSLQLITFSLMFTSVAIWILEFENASFSLNLSALIGICGHFLAFFYYNKISSLNSLIALTFSVCLLLDLSFYKILIELRSSISPSVTFFTMSIVTIALFSQALILIKHKAKKLENQHVQKK